MLFACTSAPLRMEITLVDAWVKALNTTVLLKNTSTNVMTNVEYIAIFIELGDSAMSVVASSLQGQPLQFVVPDYRNYQYSFALTAGPATTQVSMAIPAKFSSLKSIFLTVRDQGTGVLTYFSFSSVSSISDILFNKFVLVMYFFKVTEFLYSCKQFLIESLIF